MWARLVVLALCCSRGAAASELSDDEEIFRDETSFGSLTVRRRQDGSYVARNDFYIAYNFLFRMEGGESFSDWSATTRNVEGTVVVVVPAREEVTFVRGPPPDPTRVVATVTATAFTAKFGDPLRRYDGTSLVPPLKSRSVVTQGYYGASSHKNTAAVDLACVEGEDVFAARDGVVWRVVAGFSEQCGDMDPSSCLEKNQLANKVYVAHCDGTSAVYAHFQGPDKIPVRVGQAVRARVDVLGPCGTTGISSGPHLHLQIDQSFLGDDDDDDDGDDDDDDLEEEADSSSSEEEEEGDVFAVASTTVEAMMDDKCDGEAAPFLPEKGQRWDHRSCPGGYYDSCAAAGERGDNEEEGEPVVFRKKIPTKAPRAGTKSAAALALAALVFLAALSLSLVVACARRHDDEGIRPASLAVLTLTWVTTCADVAVLFGGGDNYSRRTTTFAFYGAATTLAGTFLFHAAVTVAVASDFDNWLKQNTLAIPALLVSVPSLDGLNLVLPFYPRRVAGFPNDSLCAASTARLFVVDAPHLVVKVLGWWVEKQSDHHHRQSAFAAVSAIASLLTCLLLGHRLLLLHRSRRHSPEEKTKKPISSRKKNSNRSVVGFRIDLPDWRDEDAEEDMKDEYLQSRPRPATTTKASSSGGVDAV